MLFIHPLPEVRRVIFIATPQRGSYVAAFSISQLIARLVTAPLHLARGSSEILTGNRDALAFAPTSHFGSVYGMTPGSPLSRALAPIPIAPGVKANSIIAVQGNGPIATGNDGIVTYASAHIEGVEFRAGGPFGSFDPVEPPNHCRGSAHPAGPPRCGVPAVAELLAADGDFITVMTGNMKPWAALGAGAADFAIDEDPRGYRVW